MKGTYQEEIPEFKLTDIGQSIQNLYTNISTLRGPDGCPWDRKQTLVTMRQYLIEETYEAVSAINNKDDNNLIEELGDLLLIIMMISIIGSEEKNHINFYTVIQHINDKIIRRHPHVFGNEVNASDSDEVIEIWNKIKSEEKSMLNEKHSVSASAELEDKTNDNYDKRETEENYTNFDVEDNKSFPEIERAYRIQKSASKLGFDWESHLPVIEKLKEEISELESALASVSVSVSANADVDIANVEEELGDILFTSVNLARKMKIHPSVALHNSNEKFIKRFKFVIDEMKKADKEMSKTNIDDMEEFWQASKLLARLK